MAPCPTRVLWSAGVRRRSRSILAGRRRTRSADSIPASRLHSSSLLRSLAVIASRRWSEATKRAECGPISRCRPRARPQSGLPEAELGPQPEPGGQIREGARRVGWSIGLWSWMGRLEEEALLLVAVL